ncbi:hypothetical protein CBR_g3170 [Chara braunii]|uniref:Uncharacterized protein n=1 Tax=Chara braunii TaxID=69332 RepID=A0A388KF04_CHABU|nr:hypothetical protein CBR_g3170 [Chara braunii]|eukprot:GBG68629.1 hypothetical protein CBR_g3170 [Chara braunii]
MAKYAEATKAEVMAAVGRQYLDQKDEVRREESRRGRSPPPRRRRDYADRGEGDMEVDDLDEEIRRLMALREKRRRGKEPLCPGPVLREPSFSSPAGGLDDIPMRAESSRQAEARGKTKIPTGCGPEGLMEFVLEQKMLLSAMRQDELKHICSKEGVRYCTKG